MQLGIAMVNLTLPRILQWDCELAKVPLLLRQVFNVHSWYISLTLVIFGVMTWRFAAEMGGGANPVTAWLAACMGVFGGVRAVIQAAYYSSSHWRGRPGRTVIHALALLVFGGMAAVYVWAGTRGVLQ